MPPMSAPVVASPIAANATIAVCTPMRSNRHATTAGTLALTLLIEVICECSNYGADNEALMGTFH
jgi:hypothetical protein